MGVLFLSHSSEDDELARRLKAALEERGHPSLFLDLDPETGIQAGEAWQATLYRKLRSCQALVALVTEGFLASRWCFAEVALARMQGKKLFGVRAGDLPDDAGLPALISDRQLVDGRTDFEGAVDRLARGLQRAGLASDTARVWDRDRPPYPGFSAFTEADRAVFFGRDAEIEAGLERIRGGMRGTAARLTMILGASGSGKSSLLGAGIVHRLRAEEGATVVGPFRPGSEPLQELEFQARKAFEVDAPSREPAQLLGAWLRALGRARGGDRRPVVVAVDQFEELLGRPEGHEAQAFLAEMARELASPEGDVSFVGTLRSDQLAALQSHPVGRRLEWQSLFVGPLDDADLREIVEGPARLAELELEPGLASRLVADTRDAQALPLLALMLRRLWEEASDDGLLEIREYEELGGIRGVVARVADDALAGVRDAEALDGLREALLRMVRLDDQHNAVRQPLAWDSTREEARPLLRRLVKSRLLVREAGTLQVAHEALFTAWGRLRDWIDESRQALLVHRQVSDAAGLWAQERLETDLWRGARLDRAVELRDAGLLPLDAEEEAFLVASVEARDRAREEARRQERQRERLSRVALGRGLAYQALAEAEDRPQRGLLLAAEAARATHEAGLGLTAAAETALHELLSRVGGSVLGDLGSRVRCVAFGERGDRMVAGGEDGGVAVLPLPAPGPAVVRWVGEGSGAEAVALLGDHVVARFGNGSVRVRQVEGGGHGGWEVLQEPLEEGTVSAFCPTRRLVAVAASGRHPVLHGLVTGERWALEGVEGDCTALAFSPDGAWLVDGRSSGRLAVWALDGLPEPPGSMVADEHQAPIRHIRWAGAAHVFVTTDEDHETVRRWEPGDGPGALSLTRLPSSGSPILRMAVDPTGDILVAGTWHGEALAWTRSEGAFSGPVPLRGHSSSVGLVAVSRDGRWIATGSERDNFALLWSREGLPDGTRPLALRGEDRWLGALGFAPDGSVVAGSWAGTVRRWDQLTAAPRTVSIPGVDLNRHVLSWEARTLVAAGQQVAVGRELDPRGKVVGLHEGGGVQAMEEPDPVRQVAMTPDGRRIAAAGPGGVRVLDRETGQAQVVPVGLDGWLELVVLDPGGRWLVTTEEDAALLFDLASGCARVDLESHGARLVSAAFDGAGAHLVTADAAGRVALWEMGAQGPVPGGAWDHEGVRRVGFLEEGRRWVSASPERLLTGPVLDGSAPPVTVETGWDGDHVRVALARGAGRVLVATNVDVSAWDLAAQEPDTTRVDLPRHEGYIESVAVADQGHRAATAMLDGPVRLWTLDGAGEPVALPRSQESRLLLEFVDGDRMLVTGESGGTVEAWELDPERLLERARRVAGRQLTDEERRRFLSAG